MTTERIASDLYDRAVADEQSAWLIGPSDDVDAIRAEVRRLARRHGVRIRTGIVEDATLVVIRADAKLWDESAAVMRQKLRPPGAE